MIDDRGAELVTHHDVALQIHVKHIAGTVRRFDKLRTVAQRV